jgi:MoaA/NifB/PqqE/SkfB family radical SAM enzyme
MREAAGKNWISEQLCVQMARTCNLFCVYCQNPPTGKAPSVSAAAGLIRKKGIKAVSLEGGGEPTTNPEFFSWIKTLKAAGVKHFMLSTNGVALSDPAFCRAAEKAVDYFTVNLPGHEAAVYAKATRSVKFGLALKGLENLTRLGAAKKIRLFHIVFRGNYRSLPAFADWVVRNHPGIAFVNLVFVRNRGRVRNSRKIVPRYREAEPFVKIALAKLRIGGVRAVVQNMPLCRLVNFEAFSFEFQRWRRGDRVLEAGVTGKAKSSACARCPLEPACCGARTDYLKIYGAKELTASARFPNTIKAGKF